MRSDKLLKALFALPDPREPAPAPEPPEPPRLGILHLMVLTACVAVWCGLLRTMALAIQGDPSMVALALILVRSGALYGIGGGAASAGLILFLARRWRRIPFPVHPGEYLLMVSAIGAILKLASYPVYMVLARLQFSDRSSVWLFAIIPLTRLVVNAAVFIWALVCVKAWRWRIFLLSIPVCHLAGYGLVCHLFPYGLMILVVYTARPESSVFIIPSLIPVAISVILLIVVLRDHLEGRRYPWSHWFGVGLLFWFDVVRIVSSLQGVLRLRSG